VPYNLQELHSVSTFVGGIGYLDVLSPTAIFEKKTLGLTTFVVETSSS
jgi:hypothetical protein